MYDSAYTESLASHNPTDRKWNGPCQGLKEEERGSDFFIVVHEFEPRVGLCAASSEPGAALDSVSPSPSAPPLLALCVCVSLSLSKINIKKNNNNLNETPQIYVSWLLKIHQRHPALQG